ncbi:MAG TPA: VWA domain-containing protein [Flavisolibacter sp.]|nr:VWA domain-containing protein [Flavisolibacter sp.]
MSIKYLLHFTFITLTGVFLAGFLPAARHLLITRVTADTLQPIAGNAKDYKGKSVVSTSGVIRFASGLDNDYYQLDSVNRTGYLYIETTVQPFIQENVKRVPLNLSIVIDRSGSMKGEKMEFARKAAKDILDKLKEEDYVSIVVYDDRVDVIQPSVQAKNKEAIKTKIDEIVPRGSTNLWGGAEIGYNQVVSRYKPRFINRVLLISDGLVNQGLTSARAIKLNVQRYKDDHGITLSAFGVGLDFNEVLMTEMAEAGAGNYYFIEAPEKMAAMFDKELNGLLHVAAQNAEWAIKLPDGIQAERAYPLKYEAVENVVTVKFRDLFSGETKGVLLKFRMEDSVRSPLKFAATLTYTDIATGQKRSVTNENFLNPVKNGEAYLTFFNKSVLEQTILFTANENMEKAMLDADKGNYDKALQSLDANSNYLRANAYYAADSEALQQMDSVNRVYFTELKRAKELGKDTVKLLQKTSRSESYKIRNKKQ